MDMLQVGSDETRGKAVGLLRSVVKSIISTHFYFDLERRVIEKIITRLEDNSDPAGLNTILKNIRTTRSPETFAALANMQEGLTKQEKKMWESVKDGPYHFKETPD